MTPSLRKTCIACGEEREHELRPLDIPGGDPTYRQAICRACGLRSSDPMPSDEDLARFYASTIPAAEPLEVRLRRLWLRVHDAYMIGLVERHVPSGTIVDVGAGRGRFLQQARERGKWSLMATEYSDEAIERLRADGFDARQGNLADAGLPDESVDMVWASHVIEHLPDPPAFLATVRRVLKPGGHLFALLPSLRSMRARMGLTDWHMVNPPGHLWSFTPKTLAMTLDNNGFNVLSSLELHVICEMVVVARKRT